MKSDKPRKYRKTNGEYGKRLRLTPQEEDLIQESRASSVENVNENTALTIHLKQRGIKKKDVVSVKHWQSASGDYRFSVVTKNNLGMQQRDIFNKVTCSHYCQIITKSARYALLQIFECCTLGIAIYHQYVK